jgi:magnesium-transporting ATPase (P-type)
VVFTFLPIIWYAVFDWEKDKSEFMKNPKLYKIGLEDIYFNPYVFWRWFAYAFIQGSLLLYLTFYSMDFSSTENGKNGSFFLEG